MKKILFLALSLILVVACSDDEITSSSSKGLVKRIYYDDNTSPSDNDSPFQWSFYYDSQRRIETILSVNSGSNWSSSVVFSYGDQQIIANVQVNKADSSSFMKYVVQLDSEGSITSLIDVTNSDTTRYTYTEGLISAVNDTLAVSWDNGNLGGYDYFDVYANSSNVDLNVFINSDKTLGGIFPAYMIGINKEIGAIHSRSLINNSPSSNDYDLEWDDEQNRFTKLVWNDGELTRSLEVNYYL